MPFLGFAVGLLVFNLAAAQAPALTVNSAADAGGICPGPTCTLRQAILSAVPGDTIDFAAGITTITLTSAELVITKNLTINGGDGNGVTVQRNVASGAPQFRIFNIASASNVTISALTIADGSSLKGAGIYNANGGTVNITRSTLSGNSASSGAETDGGGGVYNSNGSTVNVSNSTISGNDAFVGGGLYNENGCTMTITDSTISDNIASTGSTGKGGGIYNAGTVTISNTTISANIAHEIGGGVDNPSGTVTARNTIIATNDDHMDSPDFAGALTSQGYNLIGDIGLNAGVNEMPGDQIGTHYYGMIDPLLGPLQANGGPTFTRALLPGSRAIDKGISTSGVPTDQRGMPRPVDQPDLSNADGGDGSDIGAFEVSPIQFSPGTYSVSENDGTATLAVVRIGNTAQAATVHYATSDGTATAGSDYTNTSGDLSFAAGETNKTIPIQVLDDSIHEGDQYFKVTLSSPVGGDLGLSTAVVTIVDNDPAPTLQFSPSTYNVNENAGSAIVTVTKSGATAVPATVHYATSNGTAVAGAGRDYTTTTGVLSFAADETTKNITIPILDDKVHENNRTFGVTLTQPTNASLGPSAVATVTIVDDDPVPKIHFSSAKFSVFESAGEVIVVITKTGGTAFSATVHYATSDGTAIAGSDYVAASGNVNFGPSETTKNVSIPVLDDTIFEGDQSFKVTLTNPGGATLGSPSVATVTIMENDAPPSPTPTVTPSPTPSPSATPAKSLNISARSRVQTGENVMIGGFIVTGNTLKKVIIRAIGPSLEKSGLTGVLADPLLELHGPDGALIASDDDWKDNPDQAVLIQATGIPPQDDRESAIVATLAPARYTAIVSGKSKGIGLGLVEIYDLDKSGASKLANMSTRAFVENGNNVLIGGFILGGAKGSTEIIVRAIGPSLTAVGITNPLANPTLELRDGNGMLMAINDNWKDNPAQASRIMAAGLQPHHDLEAAIAATLPPGTYTAIVAGKSGGTGIALVEIYNLQ